MDQLVSALHRPHFSKIKLNSSAKTQVSVFSSSFKQSRSNTKPQLCAKQHTALDILVLDNQPQRSVIRAAYSPASGSSTGTFRSGQKRPEVQVPSFILRLTCDEVLKTTSEYIRLVDGAVAGGATIIQLDTGSTDPGGARLFEAACILKALLRGRAQLLVSERADIAAAAGADGVILSDQGLPAVVARRMMENASSSDSNVLPLVGRLVKSQDAAVAATAAEGADLLLLEGDNWQVPQLAERVTIPVVLQVTAPILEGPVSSLEEWQPGMSGIATSASQVKQRLGPVIENARKYTESIMAVMDKKILGVEIEEEIQDTSEKVIESISGFKAPATERFSLSTLENEAKLLTEKERLLLTDLLKLLEDGMPQMAEISLLRDALSHLDDLFLIVIVGEFNSGKSSVINALLGGKFVREGVVPTTNEITLLKFRQEKDREKEREERHPDGHFVRYLPAKMLQKMNLVDTPGTNVILERQQRLTEEFVPRADLVLFVLSADRPLSESEVSFLRYIREWGKKVVFLLNKADLLSEPEELAQVLEFIESNVRNLLSVDSVQIFPVSARRASAAKLSSPVPSARDLLQDHRWISSRFGALEDFIGGFLDGSSGAGAERLRLKLDTPLGVGAALLLAAQRQLAGEASRAQQGEEALREIGERVGREEATLRVEGESWRLRVQRKMEEAIEKAESLVDSLLTLSADSLQDLLKYLVSDVSRAKLPAGSRFEAQVAQQTIVELKSILLEYRAWLSSKSSQLVTTTVQSAASRWPQVEGDKEISVSLQTEGDATISLGNLEEFDSKAAALLLDEEIRVVALDLMTSFGAAGASATVLTAVLPNTFEDLLALGLCALGGSAGALKLPERRAMVKGKIRTVAQGLSDSLVSGMEEDVEKTFRNVEQSLEKALNPYVIAVKSESERVRRLQEQATTIGLSLKALRSEVQNLGC